MALFGKKKIKKMKLVELQGECKKLDIPFEKEDTRTVLIEKIEECEPKEEVKETRGRKPNPVSIEDLRNKMKETQLLINEFVKQHPEVNRARFNRANLLLTRILRQQLR